MPAKKLLPVASIHPDGHYRFPQFQHLVNVSRATWWRRYSDDQAPAPILISKSSTFWLGADLLAYLRNPGTFTGTAA